MHIISYLSRPAIVFACALLTICFITFSAQAQAQPPQSHKTIHVFVALCDNIYQHIHPVPIALGKGSDTKNNLYWGAMYGVKTYLKKQPDWQLLHQQSNVSPIILERLVFLQRSTNTYLVADAYKWRNIKDCTKHFLQAAAGMNEETISLAGQNSHNIKLGGGANLICYVGHNGLMDFNLPDEKALSSNKRKTVVIACKSKKYFKQKLQKSGSSPIVLTNGNMAPEAYVLHALANAWAQNKQPEEIREAVAQAYNKYQKCGINGARKLFAD